MFVSTSSDIRRERWVELCKEACELETVSAVSVMILLAHRDDSND